jgi:hypothetical protein
MNKPSIGGKVNIGCLLLILLVIAGGYVGYKFGRVYLSQYIFDRKVFELTGDAADDWKEKLFPSEVDIADDILVEREDKSVRIRVIWEGDIVIPFYTHHYYFPFEYKRDKVF